LDRKGLLENVEEFLSDVILADGVLEGEVELVVPEGSEGGGRRFNSLLKLEEACGFIVPWALQLATLAVHIHLDTQVSASSRSSWSPLCASSAS
jgi:hypothetical protein